LKVEPCRPGATLSCTGRPRVTLTAARRPTATLASTDRPAAGDPDRRPPPNRDPVLDGRRSVTLPSGDLADGL
jgi:hypothetical protein